MILKRHNFGPSLGRMTLPHLFHCPKCFSSHHVIGPNSADANREKEASWQNPPLLGKTKEKERLRVSIVPNLRAVFHRCSYVLSKPVSSVLIYGTHILALIGSTS